MPRCLAIVMLVLFGGVVWAGCGDDSTSCVAGVSCVCGTDDCDETCGGDNGGSCALTCGAGASCSLACPGGGCSVDCTGSDSCTVDCPGNNCALRCTAGTKSCTLTGCTTGCSLQCGGAATCSNSCSLAEGCATMP